MFLYCETPSTMMHVAGLLPMTPPPDAAPDYMRNLIEGARSQDVVEPWNLKLAHPRMPFLPTQSWVVDDNFDLDYHVRRSALASPGDERELGVLVSRLHSNSLDMTRPPWELHFIEGLEGGRFAIYIKVHHSLVDGYSAMKFLSRSLSTDPDNSDLRLLFNMPKPAREEVPQSGGGPLGALSGLAREVVGGASSAVSLTKALVNTQLRNDNGYANLTSSVSAPHSILNKRISRNRRFATQQYKTARLKEVGTRHGATINDVAVAIIGGGLRTFLDELGELPDRSLVAFLPVNVRPKDDEGGGNSVGAILVPVGSDIADPVERLKAVNTATQASKAQLRSLTKNAILAYSAALLAPGGIQMASAMTGITPPVPYTFNLCISNVPGPRDTLYLNGSRLEATYPVSIPMHGMALNITLQSYADTMNFGFVGCRDALPHLQRLAVYTGEALDALDAS
jgi:diacylglycerol O-acyltransferase / wax synthase